MFVERQPAHEVPLSEIVSVVVSKTRKFGTSAEEQRALEKITNEIITKGAVSKNTQETYPSGFYYSIAFKLTSREWKRYVSFNNKNLNRQFQMRLGNQVQGIIPLLFEEGITDGTDIRIATQEDNAERIKERLAPLRDKVVWE